VPGRECIRVHMRNKSTAPERTGKNDNAEYVFRPIISLRDGSLFGYEAQSSLHLVTKEALLSVSDFFFRRAPGGSLLFLPPECTASVETSKERIIREIRTPRELTGGTSEYAVVLDDVNTAFPLKSFSEHQPQYIILAAPVVRKFRIDPLFYSLVKSVIEFCRGTDVDVIAQGVGSRKELAALIDVGVSYALGPFIREPACIPCTIRKEAYECIIESNRSKNHINGLPTDVYIANLCVKTNVLPPDMLIEEVYEMIKNDADCFGYCVVENGIVQGIVTRNSLIYRMSGRYGFTLYQKKPVTSIMNRTFLAADYKTPVNQVSELAMRRSADNLYDFIVVKKNGKYYGTVTIRDLLLKSTEIQIAHARCQNPLTGLPGNTAIEDTLFRCISQGTPYCVLYIDINNFKAYNDVYGFENGDEVIQQIARDITGCLEPGQFAGHIGGDDFVVVLQPEKAESYCIAVIQSFTQKLSGFYSAEDFARGYITTANRRGDVENFPLLSLAVAGVSDASGHFSETHALTENLARLKKIVKMKGKSSFFIEKT